MGDEIRLNIGAGDTVIEGFTPIDRKLGTEAYPLPQYADNSVAEIRASHVLEHFSFEDAKAVLKEWHRALKPGGRIRVAVPDMDKCLLVDDPVQRAFYLMGGQVDGDDYHKAAYNAPLLAQYLSDAGFEKIAPFAADGIDCADHPVSLNLEAFKPLQELKRAQIKISALMSVPRVGWNDAETCISRALSGFGIPTNRVTGVFWGQCMQRGFNAAIEKGTEYVLTIDYDSMFTEKHLQQLINDFFGTPDADAMCALQRRRCSDAPLITKRDADGKVEIDGTPIQVSTGHFGLTLFRLDAVKRMEKPWFWETPDKDGDWGDGHLDQDIFFWKQWQKAGNKLYMAPLVSIGHLELVVSEFDESMQPRQLHVTDWRKKEGMDK